MREFAARLGRERGTKLGAPSTEDDPRVQFGCLPGKRIEKRKKAQRAREPGLRGWGGLSLLIKGRREIKDQISDGDTQGELPRAGVALKPEQAAGFLCGKERTALQA